MHLTCMYLQNQLSLLHTNCIEEAKSCQHAVKGNSLLSFSKLLKKASCYKIWQMCLCASSKEVPTFIQKLQGSKLPAYKMALENRATKQIPLPTSTIWNFHTHILTWDKKRESKQTENSILLKKKWTSTWNQGQLRGQGSEGGLCRDRSDTMLL